MSFLIYLIIGAICYIFFTAKNVVRNIKKGMTKNEAIKNELKEGYAAEIMMLIITLLIWPLLLIFLIKNMVVEYFAEREIKK